MSKAATPKAEPKLPVVQIVPVDPGDAHGVGAETKREIDPRYLHLTVEQLAALMSTEKPE